jgi:uncharacterized protein HemY
MQNSIESMGGILLMLILTVGIGLAYYYISTNIVKNDNSAAVKSSITTLTIISGVLMVILFGVNFVLSRRGMISQESISFYMSHLGFALSFIAVSTSLVNVSHS